MKQKHEDSRSASTVNSPKDKRTDSQDRQHQQRSSGDREDDPRREEPASGKEQSESRGQQAQKSDNRQRSDARGEQQRQPAKREQTSREKENQAGADKGEMMRKAEEAGKPGPNHKALEHFIGDWKAEVKCWMDPKGPPNVSQATARGSWIMNERFLQEDFEGDMMGKPFQGRSVIGFDNVKQAFNSVWYSDVHTSMFVTEGHVDEAGKVITLEGTASCPVRERTDIPMRVVMRVMGPNKHIFEMYDLTDGQTTKTMEITYHRK